MLNPGSFARVTSRLGLAPAYSEPTRQIEPVTTLGQSDAGMVLATKVVAEHDDELGYVVGVQFCLLWVPRLEKMLWITDFWLEEVP